MGQDVPGRDWAVLACGSNPPPNLLDAKLRLAREPDYLALYLPYIQTQTAKPFAALPDRPAGELGVACESAQDTNACRLRVDELSVLGDACDGTLSCKPFGVSTEGDDVQRFTERADLLHWLGDVDTEREAIVVAFWEGHHIACAESHDSELGTRIRRSDDGYLLETTWEDCGVQVQRDSLHVHEDGKISDENTKKLKDSNCVVGRRPHGLCARTLPAAAAPLGAFFADAARLEAASVFAFERLARELAQLGAPAELISEADRSALDEIRHARVVGALARRYGAEPEPARVAPAPLRARFAVALENAVEGCVRETFGALVAAHQAALARDPVVAAAMRDIAADEARHASLAWQVAAFLEPQLSIAERTALAVAQRDAVRELIEQAGSENLPPSAAHDIGWPEAALARALAARMAGALLTGRALA